MSKPCELQVLERLESMIRDIKKANNFYNTIVQVNTVDTSVENMTRGFPAVNILIGNVDYVTAQRNEAGQIIKKVPYILDCYYEANNEDTKVKIGRELVADFDLRFGDDTIAGNASYNLSKPAYNLEGLVLVTQPVRATHYDLENNNLSNVEYELLIGWRQSRKNPNQFYYGL